MDVNTVVPGKCSTRSANVWGRSLAYLWRKRIVKGIRVGEKTKGDTFSFETSGQKR